MLQVGATGIERDENGRVQVTHVITAAQLHLSNLASEGKRGLRYPRSLE
jgi:hypothetical protein